MTYTSPLTRRDLDGLRCHKPCCADKQHLPIVFHSFCHPADPTWTNYQNGILTIFCAVCDASIIEISVESSTPEPSKN